MAVLAHMDLHVIYRYIAEANRLPLEHLPFGQLGPRPDVDFGRLAGVLWVVSEPTRLEDRPKYAVANVVRPFPSACKMGQLLRDISLDLTHRPTFTIRSRPISREYQALLSFTLLRLQQRPSRIVAATDVHRYRQ